MHSCILFFFLGLGTVIGGNRIFDVISSGWAPVSESVSKNTKSISDCAIYCVMTPGCVGGRFDDKTQMCHLSPKLGPQLVMHYQKVTETKDVTFGLRCDPETGFTKFPSRSVFGKDISVLWRSMSTTECMKLCSQQIWCRSVEWKKELCTLSNVSNMTDTPVDDVLDFWNRNC